MSGKYTFNRYAALVVLFMMVYAFGLHHRVIPSNGDEWVYAHITRLTALSWQESKAILPLQSAMPDMRNTKPPLLFWQGLVSTNGGTWWSPLALRLPTVFYTLGIGALMLLLLQRLSRLHASSLTAQEKNQPLMQMGATGLLAVAIYLAYFSTYRYGRPFLTDAPKTFWLLLSAVMMLGYPDRYASFIWRTLIGIALGLGLAYKSPALLVPMLITFAWWRWREINETWLPKKLTIKILFSANGILEMARLGQIVAVALGIFSLWFIVDPDPQSVWREFVMGENIGKFDPHGKSYIENFLVGGQSVFALMMAFILNTGLLLPPCIALIYVMFRRRRSTILNAPIALRSQVALLVMIGVFLLVFSLPSQRSGRYLLDVMPLVAILMSLYWQAIPRWTFCLSLMLVAILTIILHAVTMQLGMILDATNDFAWAQGLSIFIYGLIAIGMMVKTWTRVATLIAIAFFYVLMSLAILPINDRFGVFSDEVIYRVGTTTVAVPCTFRASDEGYRFVLPSADIVGVQDTKALSPWQHYPISAVWSSFPSSNQRLPMINTLSIAQDCPECISLGSRVVLRSRSNPAEQFKADSFSSWITLLIQKNFVLETLWLNPNIEISSNYGVTKTHPPCH